MKEEEYCLDASMSKPELGMFCFCPIEKNDSGDVVAIITGLNLLLSKPPDNCHVVYHPDGQQACEEWCEKWNNILVEIGMKEGAI